MGPVWDNVCPSLQIPPEMSETACGARYFLWCKGLKILLLKQEGKSFGKSVPLCLYFDVIGNQKAALQCRSKALARAVGIQ